MLIQSMLLLHIAAGFMALVAGFISMLNRKGSKPHRLLGKIFFMGMTVLFMTASVLAIAKNLAFLFMVGFFSYYLACSGYRILHLKKLHLNQKPKPLDWLVSIIGLLAGLSLTGFSFVWFTQRGSWGFVPLAFGLLCLRHGITDIRSYFRAPKNKLHWISTHGTRMGGSFAATLTAFIVVNVEIGPYTWLLWILPGVLTGIWISATIKKFLTPVEKNAVSV